MAPRLPLPRGPLSAALIDSLSSGAPLQAPSQWRPVGGALSDADLQLALYCCYELHYRGFHGVADSREWDTSLLSFRASLEAEFERGLNRFASPSTTGDPAEDIAERLRTFSGPSLSTFAAERATRWHMQELCIHRSAYQLKEADPHTWAIPRLSGRAKAAMVEIQTDEYGGGVESAMHCSLFADTMDALGLDSSYGAYLDVLPAVTLATVNLVTMFGLHRRLRGELVGHLSVFEMTSVVPMGRYSRALSRLGYGPGARRFFDVHVEADAHHQVVAVEDLIGGLMQTEPQLAARVVRGAEMLLAVEDAFARHVLDSWAAGRSSLDGRADLDSRAG